MATPIDKFWQHGTAGTGLRKPCFCHQSFHGYRKIGLVNLTYVTGFASPVYKKKPTLIMLQKEEAGHEADRGAESLVSAPRTSLRAVEAVEAVDSTAQNSRMEETSNNCHGEQAGVQKAMALKRYMTRNMFALVFLA